MLSELQSHYRRWHCDRSRILLRPATRAILMGLDRARLPIVDDSHDGDDGSQETCGGEALCVSRMRLLLSRCRMGEKVRGVVQRSEEHTSELQSQFHLVCRL